MRKILKIFLSVLIILEIIPTVWWPVMLIGNVPWYERFIAASIICIYFASLCYCLARGIQTNQLIYFIAGLWPMAVLYIWLILYGFNLI